MALNKIRVDIMRHPIFLKTRKSPMRRLYLMNRKRLNFSQRKIVDYINSICPELEEIYMYKEAIVSIYNIRGLKRADKALTKLTDAIALSGKKTVNYITKRRILENIFILTCFS